VLLRFAVEVLGRERGKLCLDISAAELQVMMFDACPSVYAKELERK
jgi:hypothetical protein